MRKDGTHLAYLPGLDGLRAVAVLAVMLYHAGMAWMPGGYLGVEVFFVLSGFLITSLLLAEWRQTGKIDLGAFWMRRARRLLPALFFLLVVSVLFALLFLPEEVAGLREDVVAASTYVTNWYLIFNQESYFEFVGRPSLLQHLWSLAIEEQFYLLWPLLFIGWMMLLRSRRGMAVVALAGAALSAVLMAVLFTPDTDPSRLYYGTDTRAVGLLLGCALAFVWSPASDRSRARVNRAVLLDLGGVAALAALVYLLVNLDETQPFLYQGGFVVLGLVTAALIASVAHPQAILMPALLGFGPLRWIGTRSYSLYLWHWPIYSVTRPELDVPFDGAPLLIFRLALTVALAEISYRYIEKPIRSGMLGKQWREMRQARGMQRRLLSARFAGVGAMVTGLVLLLGAGLASAKPPPTPDYLLVSQVNSSVDANGNVISSGDFEQGSLPQPTLPTLPILVTGSTGQATEAAEAEPTPGNRPEATEAVPLREPVPPGDPTEEAANPPVAEASPTTALAETATPSGPTKTPEPPTITPTPAPTATPMPEPEYARLDPPAGHVVAIGDSVMIRAAKDMQKVIGEIEIDATVSRQLVPAIALLKTRRQEGKLGDVVVLHLGSNGTFSEKHFDQIMAELADVRRVVFLNVKVPRRWEGGNNKVITEGVARYPNAVLVDWKAYATGHPEYFEKDGIHIKGEGVKLYVRLIAATVGRGIPTPTPVGLP
jgi:peptidoglycan/LPS O-acetylase OafA/YrhL